MGKLSTVVILNLSSERQNEDKQETKRPVGTLLLAGGNEDQYFHSSCFVFLFLRLAISAPNICLAFYACNVLIQT